MADRSKSVKELEILFEMERALGEKVSFETCTFCFQFVGFCDGADQLFLGKEVRSLVNPFVDSDGLDSLLDPYICESCVKKRIPEQKGY